MWTPVAAVVLLVATGQGMWIAVLLVERRRVTIAIERLQVEVRAVLRAAEDAADAAPESAPTVEVRPIGFRA